MADVLDYLAGCEVVLAVATSKPEPFAIPIVEHLGFARYFATVGGDELDGSLRTKALVIEKVLRRLSLEPSDSVVMVGDRAHDVIGARSHGLRCVGAGWGYGMPGELAKAGADPICERPADLLAALGVAA
jgi:phosphoglycolate phosphatase